MKSLLILSPDALDQPGAAAADLVALDLAAGAGRPAPVRAAGLYVRIAPVDAAESPLQLDAAMALAPDGIVLDGAASGRDVTLLDVRLSVREAELGLAHRGTLIVAIAGASAAALFEMGTFRTASPRLAGLAFDAQALCRDLGEDDAAACDLARTLVRLAARAAGVPAFEVEGRRRME